MPNFRIVRQFLLLLLKNFSEDRCQRSAAALCYTTLLSLVPLTAVVFSVLSAFPVFESIATDIQNFVFQNFVPASSEIIQQHLEQFAGKASQLTAIGIGFLILSALLLMNTIEAAMNDIWHVSVPRKALPKFMVYWATLTLGPILMGTSLIVTSYLASLPFFTNTALLEGLWGQLLALLPFLTTTLACTLLYAIVPNTRVSIRHAIIGATVAAALFELAKKAFAYYVTEFPTYEVVYGALASIPVFLVWVYLSWLVILLGAEITYSLAHYRADGTPHNNDPRHQLLHDFRIIGHLWQSQYWGELMTPEDFLANDPFLDKQITSCALERLEKAGLIHHCEGKWALTKDISAITLGDLYNTEGYALPHIASESVPPDPWNESLLNVVLQANNEISSALNIPLHPIYKSSEDNPEPTAPASAIKRNE